MSTVEKFKELFSANRRLIKKLFKTIENKDSNYLLASMIIERRGQKIKKLDKEVEVISKDNNELRDKILAYDSGLTDPEMIPRKVADHKQRNDWKTLLKGGGQIKQVRITQYENVKHRTWKEDRPRVCWRSVSSRSRSIFRHVSKRRGVFCSTQRASIMGGWDRPKQD